MNKQVLFEGLMIQTIIKPLSYNKRLVLMMFYFEGLNIKEISKIMQSSDSDVYQTINSAKIDIKNRMIELNINNFSEPISYFEKLVDDFNEHTSIENNMQEKYLEYS